LRLRNLHLCCIDNNYLNHCHSLFTLLLCIRYLQDNQIETISPGTFNGLKSLVQLRLESNHLICDCSLTWIRELAFRIKGASVNCHLPENLKGRNVLSLSPYDFQCGKPLCVSVFD
jgi:hypothetical protein